MFGRMSGKTVLDNNEILRFEDVPCFFEESANKY